MAVEFRAWAMRTSRDTQDHRKFIRNELEKGCLRSGWGYEPEQDLRQIQMIINDENKGWAALGWDQRAAWRHRKMLGEGLHQNNAGMWIGDIVLVPNMPEEGYFTLCRITGPYEYSIDSTTGDFGHFRKVELLTPGGVSNINNLVSRELRSSLRCRSRLWWIGSHQGSIEAIIATAVNSPTELRDGTDHVRRAELSLNSKFKESLDRLADEIVVPLRKKVGAAEWEPVFRQALLPLLQEVTIVENGGPGEQGADLEIHFPNPFEPHNQWIVAIQVKDFDGVIQADIADQLEEAIQTRQGDGQSGRLVSVVLASTNARPSEELSKSLEYLSEKYNITVSCIHGKDFMRLVANGLFISFRDRIS